MIDAAMLQALRAEVLPHVQHIDSGGPSRAELLAWALAAMVPAQNWKHPAQADAIADVGRLFALVMSGCEFSREPSHDSDVLFCVRVRYHGADYFAGARCDTENFWLPALRLLVEQPDADWYGTRGPGGAASRRKLR